MQHMSLVSLDDVLDTRLGTLATIDRRYLTKILNEDTPYFKRVIDDFEWLGEGVTKQFQERYAQRDVNTLMASFKTMLVPQLTTNFVSIMLQAHEHPVWNSVGLELNTWPYVLTKSQKELFRESVELAICGEDIDTGDVILDINVSLVNIPQKELTMSQMAKRWQTVFMYDFIGWTNEHAEDFKEEDNEMIAVQTEIKVPALFREMIDKKSLLRPDGTHINPFHESKRHFALWFNLGYENPQLFSIPDPASLERKA